MDVTSLLNSGAAAAAAAAEQQKLTESSRSTPTKSRTPWDAGGYSLPINTLSLAPSPSQKAQNEDSQDLENQTSTSPKQHKFSDSRSSLSSFTSSLQSATHSRYSSMSTINSTHQLSNLSLESLSPKSKNATLNLELATIESNSEPRISISLSPTGSLDTLALVAEHHPLTQPAQQLAGEGGLRPALRRGTSLASAQGISPNRPSSPSDAILIKRTAAPILRVNTGDADLKRAELSQQLVPLSLLFPFFVFSFGALHTLLLTPVRLGSMHFNTVKWAVYTIDHNHFKINGHLGTIG